MKILVADDYVYTGSFNLQQPSDFFSDDMLKFINQDEVMRCFLHRLGDFGRQ